MRTVVFDLESDGLLNVVSKVWCLATYCIEEDKLISFGPTQIQEALEYLYEADELVAHNGITYDLKVLQKLFQWGPRPGCNVTDTLVLARVSYPDIKRTDGDRIEAGWLDKKLWGKHSLKAWGQRLGNFKGDYEGGWSKWSQEMQDYCDQDVRVTADLYKFLKNYPDAPKLREPITEVVYSAASLELEQRVEFITDAMTKAGWHFDEKKAALLYTRLVNERHALEQELIAKFGSWTAKDKLIVPKRDNKTLGYTAGVAVQKYKTVTFNPNSRMHIEKKLREMGWVPTEFTNDERTRAKIDEAVLEGIQIPEAERLITYLLVAKRLSQLADGEQGWMRVVTSGGTIHARYNIAGTVTGRASHSSPNIAQVPKVKKNKAKEVLYDIEGVFGAECRELFTVPKGWMLVGADMGGLELRCLAHYMATFDGGRYGKIVCEGDVHTENMNAAGLPDRDTAKTFIYAFLYGAGNEKIGSIVGKGAQHGGYLKQKFMRGLPALGKLINAVKKAAKAKGWLKGLDGRQIPIRSQHAALNSLLQSAGAVLCKTWLANFWDEAHAAGLKHGYAGDFVICGWIHDELQVACKPQHVDLIRELLGKCGREAGDAYGFKIPLISDSVVGKNWKETH